MDHQTLHSIPTNEYIKKIIYEKYVLIVDHNMLYRISGGLAYILKAKEKVTSEGL